MFPIACGALRERLDASFRLYHKTNSACEGTFLASQLGVHHLVLLQAATAATVQRFQCPLWPDRIEMIMAQ